MLQDYSSIRLDHDQEYKPNISVFVFVIIKNVPLFYISTERYKAKELIKKHIFKI